MEDRGYILSLDLGQTSDPSALVLMDHKRDIAARQARDYFNVRNLKRYRLQTAYTTIAEDVKSIMERPELEGRCTLVIDRTGVGRPVFDIFRHLGLKPIGITIMAGQTVKIVPGGYNVPKRDLAMCGQVLLQSGRLTFEKRAGREVETLKGELQNFQLKITTAGNDTYEAWRENDHDDLVLALLQGVWWGSRAEKVSATVGRTRSARFGVIPPRPKLFHCDDQGRLIVGSAA